MKARGSKSIVATFEAFDENINSERKAAGALEKLFG
jgi:hypothetical protein